MLIPIHADVVTMTAISTTAKHRILIKHVYDYGITVICMSSQDLVVSVI